MKKLIWLKPLPIPEEFERKAYRLPVASHFIMGLAMNILSLALPVMMLQVYDRIIPHKSYSTLFLLVAGVMVALALDAVLRIVRAWLVGWTASSREHAANCAVMARLTAAELPAFEQISAGEHLQNLSALGRLREFYSGQALSALVDVPFAVVFIGLIAYLGGILVVVPLGLLLLFIVVALLAGNRLKQAIEARGAADDKKASLMVSILTGLHTVKAQAMEASLMRHYEARQSHVTTESYRVASASGVTGTISAAMGQLSLILTTLAGCIMVIRGDLSVGGLSACTLLAGRSIQPVQRVLGTWLRLQDLTVSRRQAENLFTMPARARDAEPAPVVEGRVELDRVCFSYRPDQVFLSNINLEVAPGEAIAIGGEKSSGKSTLLHIMAGLVSAQSGSVRIGGIDPARFSLAQLGGQVGYLPQAGTIFRGTVLENLTGFRMDPETIARAKDTGGDLGIDGIVDHLPRGYETMLQGNNADPLPPGVKQRIALARVLMQNPSVLLFDDADRALDKEGYNRLFRLLGRLRGQCTIIMVSHDQNLLSFVDRSYHLADGKLTDAIGPGMGDVFTGWQS